MSTITALQAIKNIVANGVDITKVHSDGEYLIHKVVKTECPTAVQAFMYLLERGASYQVINADGKTPIDLLDMNSQKFADIITAMEYRQLALDQYRSQ